MHAGLHVAHERNTVNAKPDGIMLGHSIDSSRLF